ncbi:MAG TPA: hypothetical protein VGP64_00125 [Polyangia bacterium]
MTKQVSSRGIALGLACFLMSLSACGGGKASDAGDAGGDQLSCAGQTAITCIMESCSNDIGAQAVCVNGVQSCPPGSVECN